MNTLSKIVYIIFGVSLIFLTSCSNKTEEKTAVDEHPHHNEDIVSLNNAQYKTARIELGHIESRQLSGTVKVNGTLDIPPQSLVSISVPYGGFLKETSLLQGVYVKKGQVIAVMENQDYIKLQQDYIENSSRLEYLEAEFNRQKMLSQDNVNSEKTLQKAKSDYHVMRAKVKGLYATLTMLKINPQHIGADKISSTINLYAPISGYVTQVNVNIGSFVSPTDVLFRIVNTEHLHAELIVYEKDIPKIMIGQKVKFTLANEIKQRTATVYLVGKEISEDRTVRIHCHLDKEDSQLIPGMYLSAYVETDDNSIPSLPDESIVFFEGKNYVFIQMQSSDSVKDNHEFQLKEVILGVKEAGYREVIFEDSKNTANFQIVIRGAYSLLSKMKNTEEEGGHGH